MGGGGLRILPHKKWHVWRRENIERVLKDERENEEKQQDLDVKKRKLEQERRAQQLLLTEEHDQEPRQHINFFKTEEAQASHSEAVNYGKKKEMRVDETLRRHGKLPWYAQTEAGKKKELTAKQERKRKSDLEIADPLQQMRPKKERGQRLLFTVNLEDKCQSKYADSDEGLAGRDRRKYSARYDHLSVSSGRGHRRRYVGEDGADTILNKRTKHRDKKSKSKHKLGKQEALVLELRRERQEREASERRRAEKLMYG